MKNPKFFKIQYGNKITYQTVFKRNHLNIRLSNPYEPTLRYRLFFNFNVIIERDEGGNWFRQFHRTLKSAKAELSRYAQFKKPAPRNKKAKDLIISIVKK